MTPLKEIEYRGGVATFSIPATWCEEYDPDGGGTFYEDVDDSGTLRLNVVTMQAPDGAPLPPPADALTKASPSGDPPEVETLPSGNAMASYIDRTTEDGHEISIYYWEVANPVPPMHLRLAVFSYTILTSQESEFASEVALLKDQISQVRFADVLGE